jgi:hypothetical protein
MKQMKLTNLIQQSNRSFASVFLAFSLFGFLFPHHANQVTGRHQVNLQQSEQKANQQTNDWTDPTYEWFY